MENEQINTKTLSEFLSQQIYTKKQLREMGFSFTLNGDIVSPDELEEHYRKYVENLKEKLINKSCEYLNSYIWESVDDDDDPIIESVRNTTKEDFIKDFKRFVEEQV